ncbi:YcxB family protein [Streptomyces sp. NPDC020403]|uniref:YcxB family protein n=1 Tax=unclassified Streptomyces TaxID=2593676 RepID=UPI0033C21C60
MTEGLSSTTEEAVVALRYELGRPDWSDAFRARGRALGMKGRMRGLALPVFLVGAVWLLSGDALMAGFAFLGCVSGLALRTGALAAWHTRMGAPLGPWSVAVADSGDGVRLACADMETRRGWRSLGGYVETATGFVLLSPAPYLLVVHYLPKRAVGREATDRLRAILDHRLPHRGVRPQHPNRSSVRSAGS